jgi:NADPH:quinone reductase-like Zn-dependent oxidoreductase
MPSTQQKALLLPEKQGRLTVGESTTPKPGPGQLLVRAYAAALNPVDVQIRDIGFGIAKYPAIIGFDGAGQVVEVGEGVTTFTKGDRVWVYTDFLYLRC